MKILHTSDWHLGHTLYNYDRTVEQQAFLRQLTRIVTEAVSYTHLTLPTSDLV